MAKTAPQTWVRFDPLTYFYTTPDGTVVAGERVDDVACLADVLNIAIIRENQRKAIAAKEQTK